MIENLREADRCFWLDGIGSTSWSGGKSLVGVLDDDDVSLTYDAVRREVTRHQSGFATVVGNDIFDVLGDSLDGSPATHWVGYFGYACRPDLPARPAVTVPDAVWMQTRNARWEASPPHSAVAPHPVGPSVPVDPSYAAAFAAVQEQLLAGNSYEVNLTYRLSTSAEATRKSTPSPLRRRTRAAEACRDDKIVQPWDVYQRLRAANPAPYAGYVAHQGTHLLSASPERYASIDQHRWVETRPIKGTTPRGATPQLDAELRDRLRSDPKFRAEHLMIVDLLRNDLAMVCAVGTVTVPELMQVESYASVHQLVSTIRGQLRPEIAVVDALRAMFPAGSMTGAPKLRTMDIIHAVEPTPRGVYAGAFGWISGDGRADLGVVIRSLVRDPAAGWQIGTGGGITVRSNLQEEWDESCWKAERVLGVLD